MGFDYEWFKDAINRLTGIDLSLYKENQMKRRIDTLILRLGLDGYAAYVDAIQNDQARLKHFLGYITINVTEFFRTSEHWDYLVQNIMPRLGKNSTIWSTACSTGEEPYSIVMSLADYLPLSDIHIIATDIDEEILKIAKRGEYKEAAVATVPARYLSRYFIPLQGGYRICDEVRQCVEFRRFDLLKEDFPKQCDLIVCRNVLIYFTDAAKQRLFRVFLDKLKDGGYLFTGHTEQIVHYKEVGFAKEKTFLYYRPNKT